MVACQVSCSCDLDLLFLNGNVYCAGLKAGSQHGKSKHKAEPCITQASVADDCKIAAAKAPAPVKKGKVQKATRKPGKGKSAGRVGLINPTPEEIKTAFSMFNPHNKSVIDAQDIARVSDSLQLSHAQACIGAASANSEFAVIQSACWSWAA